ncbi:Zinc finger RING FYVE PHD-type [Pyrenophora seminiperda CCB06]|uniref:Zinc finger RING FYVE PHD-type n=1 Tax=Pyrenophora seminiperda CCB06 TaxID=1302712 RepID=A0A3M7M6F5_9PLEO|nr:Zinc finger RING FYVE PHD-type [Pyrenophora seminiperda CCB06]
MTPTAFSFLIPVFVVAIAAPFLCVFCIRRRRQPPNIIAVRPALKIKKPALRRAEAREKLLEVTEVVDLERSRRRSSDGGGDAVEGAEEEAAKPVTSERESVSEKECAICLSALHAPAPPEPAKLSPGAPITDEAAILPSITSPTNNTPETETTTPETILKLTTCAHEFHAECLVSWFVLRKTSCPICRSVYMSKEVLDRHDEEEQAALNAGVGVVVPASVEPAVVEEGRARGPVGVVRNWHYFLRGRSAGRREIPSAGVVEVEMQTQGEGRGGAAQGAVSAVQADAPVPARSWGQRLLRRG